MIEGKHRESTVIAQLCDSTVDLREEVARLEDALQAAQSQIAASQQIIRRMREERDELAAALAFAVECARAAGYTGTLREPPVALAAVKARAKAEGLREAAETFSLESQPFKLWHPHDVADELDRMAAQGEGKSPA
jgi:hypothetical protein